MVTAWRIRPPEIKRGRDSPPNIWTALRARQEPGAPQQPIVKVGEVGLLRDYHNKLKDRVKATEEMMNETTPQVKTLMQKIACMDTELKTLAIKVENTDTRFQRHNIRLVEVPKKAEGPSLELYIEKWLSEVVMRGALTKFFSMERAH
ncbi:hypothetical protein NDU88_004233 [Pleurodeles waltl]|uniref:Uncharacterized protein n=1 Tax=Pleurodeles waltl TaxID=8319 RepID=A0AAV7LHX9_PLEWA|nr:hypothetical protein NDU88_004233 [Pleurodeles waltl]